MIGKIDRKTDKGAFEIAFREGTWSLNNEGALPLFKALIKQHNHLIDELNKRTPENSIRFNFTKKPTRINRFFCKLLLGWIWVGNR
jgi:hypothetical protein|tara:strand:+ start:9216 stop:9473 length:258 start_codon:yes stop_codon:yes gene_type:complete